MAPIFWTRKMRFFQCALLGVVLVIQAGFLGTTAWGQGETNDVRNDCEFIRRSGGDEICLAGIAGVRRCLNRDRSGDPPVNVPGTCAQTFSVLGKRCECIPNDKTSQMGQVAALKETVVTLSLFPEVFAVDEEVACGNLKAGIDIIQSTCQDLASAEVLDVYTTELVHNLDTTIVGLQQIGGFASQCSMTFDPTTPLETVKDKKNQAISAYFTTTTPPPPDDIPCTVINGSQCSLTCVLGGQQGTCELGSGPIGPTCTCNTAQ